MTTFLASGTPNRHAVRCDARGCAVVFEPAERRYSRYAATARTAADIAGWQVRPVGGPGARTAADLCPAHRSAP